MKKTWYQIHRNGGLTATETGASGAGAATGPKAVTMDDDDFENEEKPGATGVAEDLNGDVPPATSAPVAPVVDNAIASFLESQGFVEGKYIAYAGQEKVDFNSLPEADKLNVLQQLVQPKLDGDLKVVSDLMATGVSIKDIARQILADDVDYASLSEEQIHTIAIKKEYGDDLEQDAIDAEIARRKQSPLFKRQTDKLRADMEAAAEKTDLNSVAGNYQQTIQQQIDAEAAEFAQAAMKVENYHGFVVTDEQRNMVLKNMVEVDANLQSQMIRDLQDPVKAFEREYAYQMMPNMIAYFEKELREQGDRIRKELLEGAPSQPINSNRLGQPALVAPKTEPAPAAPAAQQQIPGQGVLDRINAGSTRQAATAGGGADWENEGDEHL